jgi:hypothetical protein
MCADLERAARYVAVVESLAARVSSVLDRLGPAESGSLILWPPGQYIDPILRAGDVIAGARDDVGSNAGDGELR